VPRSPLLLLVFLFVVGCAAPKTVEVPLEQMFEIYDPGEATSSSIKIEDARRPSLKQTASIPGGVRLGDDRLRPSVPDAVRQSLSSVLNRSTSLSEQNARLLPHTVRLTAFEATIVAREPVTVRSPNPLPGPAVIDSAMRTLAQQMANSSEARIEISIEINGQTFRAVGVRPYAPSTGSASLKASFQSAVSTLATKMALGQVE